MICLNREPKSTRLRSIENTGCAPGGADYGSSTATDAMGRITGLRDGRDYDVSATNAVFEARASASDTIWNVLTKLNGLTLIESIPNSVSAAAISG